LKANAPTLKRLRWIPRIAQLIALLMAGKTGKKKVRLRTGNNTN